jgi:hypothetical protein
MRPVSRRRGPDHKHGTTSTAAAIADYVIDGGLLTTL